jgi:hypothetical protein
VSHEVKEMALTTITSISAMFEKLGIKENVKNMYYDANMNAKK